MLGPVSLAYALAAVGLLVGVGIVWRLFNDDSVDNDAGKFAYLLVIPGFAAVSYVLMAAKVGQLTIGGNSILLPRYVDWLVTTPVLVGYVGYVAGAPRRWVLGVALADALMILFGSVATVLDPPLKWALFAVSAGCHLALFVIVYRVFPRYAPTGNTREGLFRLLQNHIGLLWIAYPVIWVASPAGIDAVSAVGISLTVAYLDVVAKTPYVWFVWMNRQAFDDGGPETAVGPSDGGATASGAD